MANQPQVQDVWYVTFNAEFNDETADTLIKACVEIANKKAKEIHILMNTQGGGVVQGMGVYNILRALPTKIVMYNVGVVNSIGIIVFLAGEKRFASPESTFTFHGVGATVQQNYRFEEQKLSETLDGIRSDNKRLADIIRDRATFKNPTDVAELFRQQAVKDVQFAKDNGIINDVCQPKIPLGAPIFSIGFKR